MGEITGITWTDHTFNAWWGCTKVSPGCDNCYAEKWDKRTGQSHWGPGTPRRVFGEKRWGEPLKWNAAAAKSGRRARVFCSSMADVFDAEAPEGQLERLWALIRATPNLDWQLLTKRHGRIGRSLPWDWGEGYRNVWLGVTVENQEMAEQRIPVLVGIPASVRFLSVEPQIGPVDLTRLTILKPDPRHGPGARLNSLTGHIEGPDHILPTRIGWVICGGESGPGARPFELAWARSLRDQCRAAGVAFFCKQLGTAAIDEVNGIAGAGLKVHHDASELISKRLKDRKGGDWSEWPADLRVREFPEPRP